MSEAAEDAAKNTVDLLEVMTASQAFDVVGMLAVCYYFS